MHALKIRIILSHPVIFRVNMALLAKLGNTKKKEYQPYRVENVYIQQEYIGFFFKSNCSSRRGFIPGLLILKGLSIDDIHKSCQLPGELSN